MAAEAAAASAYGVDTEFHRERTYWPQLALVQLNWGTGNVLIDPLAVDLAPLAKVFEGPGVAVMHAAAQDLEVLELACGTVPRALFDTQVAAGFMGIGNASLASLVEQVLGVRLPKADRLTDWLRRPLGADQLRYAGSDVEHLLALRDRICDELEQRGRREWALDECEELRSRPRPVRDPEHAWLRVKDARSLRGSSRAVAQSVAEWREERAARLDVPPRFVLSDMALIGIAHRPPTDVAALRRVRGLDARSLKGDAGAELLAAVRQGRDRPAPPRPDNRQRTPDGRLRAAVGLVSAWISQLSRDLELDPGTLATRADVEAFLAGDPDARLNHGWRAEVVGQGVRDLVDGRAALAFEPSGALVLEPRSR